jgi:NAD(P)-dependent dehydrogenase (short-subunit alcohol dehydrogenase family)
VAVAINGSQPAVLVTGASRGIGFETALALASAGFGVWAGVRNSADRERLDAEASSRGVTLQSVAIDVTSEQSVSEAVSKIGQEAGGLYGLVNNAGITGRAPFEEFPESELRRIFEVNVFGTMRVTRHAIPLMRRAGRGRIVMLSSIGGRIAAPSVAPYTASKFAVEGFGEALYLEMRPFGIDVSIIAPGIVKTGIWDEDRRILAAARDEKSPYYDYFRAGEDLVEKALKSSKLTAPDVARVVVKVVTAPRPRLRYIVGQRASLVVALRRHLPGELFERLYFGEYLRRIISGAKARTR